MQHAKILFFGEPARGIVYRCGIQRAFLTFPSPREDVSRGHLSPLSYVAPSRAMF